MRDRHFRGYDGAEITADGERTLWFVIRDWFLDMIDWMRH